MLFTSNFRISGKDPKAVAICRGTRGYPGVKTYRKLAPTAQSLKLCKTGAMSDGEFAAAYQAEVLSKLDPHTVVKDLLALAGEGVIMLCWEPPGEFCHRQLAAEWLTAAGYSVREVVPDRIAKGGSRGAAKTASMRMPF